MRTTVTYYNYPPEAFGLTTSKLDNINNPSLDFFYYQYQVNANDQRSLESLIIDEFSANTTIYVWVKYRENSTQSYVNPVYFNLLQIIEAK